MASARGRERHNGVPVAARAWKRSYAEVVGFESKGKLTPSVCARQRL